MPSRLGPETYLASTVCYLWMIYRLATLSYTVFKSVVPVHIQLSAYLTYLQSPNALPALHCDLTSQLDCTLIPDMWIPGCSLWIEIKKLQSEEHGEVSESVVLVVLSNVMAAVCFLST